jgi:hypothetical protein
MSRAWYCQSVTTGKWHCTTTTSTLRIATASVKIISYWVKLWFYDKSCLSSTSEFWHPICSPCPALSDYILLIVAALLIAGRFCLRIFESIILVVVSICFFLWVVSALVLKLLLIYSVPAKSCLMSIMKQWTACHSLEFLWKPGDHDRQPVTAYVGPYMLFIILPCITPRPQYCHH